VDAGRASVNGAIVRDNLVAGIVVGQFSGNSTTIARSTLFANAANGVLLSGGSSTSSVRVVDSIIVGSVNGVNHADSSRTTVELTELHDNSNPVVDLAPGTWFVGNPLFVSASDLHLTSRSPARLAGSSGQDLGALPYAGQASPGLYGVLHEDTTLSVAGSPYLVEGDLTVAAGVRLTIEPGTTLRFASGDLMSSGVDLARAELNVAGVIGAAGRADAPIQLRGAAAAESTWYGVRLLAGAAGGTLAHVLVSDGVYGLTYETTGENTLVASTFEKNKLGGVRVLAGTPLLDRVTVRQNGDATSDGSSSNGVTVQEGAQVTLDHCIAAENTGHGVGIYWADRSTNRILHSTLVANGHGGIDFFSGGFGSFGNTILVENSILANEDDVSFSGDTILTLRYSSFQDFDDLHGVGVFRANPLLVSASNPRPTANSPARFASDTGGTIGALEYEGDPSPGIWGTLWTNQTLTVAGSPYLVRGDVLVPPGVTLTIEPGVTLAFAARDQMRGGDYFESEVLVRGTLVAEGTPSAPITFSRDPGELFNRHWGGIHVLPGGTLSMRHGVVEDVLDTGLRQDPFSLATVVRSTFRANSHGLAIGGRATLDGVVALANGDGIQVSSSEATIINSVARQNNGFGIEVSTTGLVTLTNVTSHKNGGPGVSVNGMGGGVVNLRNSIVSENAVGVVNATGPQQATLLLARTDLWNNTQAGLTCTDCLAVDPGYLSATNLRLSAQSGCIDVGQAAGAPDHDAVGVARPVDGNGDGGAQFDLGAYEFNGSCGNGALDVEEACDDGADNGSYGHCVTDCSGPGPFCGDGTVNGPEQCDDANHEDHDACTDACRTAVCGDGIVQAGVESCDDGNQDDGDACTHACLTARCGDGLVHLGVEACDDGNGDDTDACTRACEAARCGDGIVRVGVEECDDGNVAAGDGCSASCTREPPAPPDAGPQIDAGPGPQPEPEDGCGCQVGGAGGVPWSGLLLGILLGLGLIVRRRR
jgi:MYXO-CTERM domain-containing protein